MTWAPRGILRTTSASVGRSTTKRRPVDAATVDPSCCPMTSSWATMPEWVWNDRARVQRDQVAPLLGVDQQHALAGSTAGPGPRPRGASLPAGGRRRRRAAVADGDHEALARAPGARLQATLAPGSSRLRRTSHAAAATASHSGSPPRPRRTAPRHEGARGAGPRRSPQTLRISTTADRARPRRRPSR